ncbi:MAG TPA: hypothetical protein DDW50_20390 [Firmicutes bacterium]|jgi:hypothetical protein|nr:hypothetical protein [Bacillota bacterium]
MNYESAWNELKEWTTNSALEFKCLCIKSNDRFEEEKESLRYIEFQNFIRKMEEIEYHSRLLN